MANSYNGWSASPTLAIRSLVVAGEPFTPGVRDDDDVYTVLQYVAQQMHERVEPIVRSDWHQADDWGFSYRPTTNDNSLSCHASGTAIDYNSTRHPYGVAVTRNFTMEQVAIIHDIIDDLPITWGGDYRYSVDAMHFEITGNKATVAAAAARIRNIGRDWFDMATREELREVVDNAINDPVFIKKVANQVTNEVWRREFNATNANGTEVKKPAREFLKETWEMAKSRLPK